MRRIIIDSDTASDDAVAIMMALAAPQVSLEALTIVAGNVTLAQASLNARQTLTVSKATQVPVYEGCDRPWLRPNSSAEWFHGNDGMGNMYYPRPSKQAETNHAVSELIARFKEAPGDIDLITLGPLTNIATALVIEPELAKWVKHCYIMGGATTTPGNASPVAEYNFWFDPEAARKVLHSGMKITLVGWELCCGDAALSDQEMEAIMALGNNRARMAIEIHRSSLDASKNLQRQTGLALADPVAMAIALDASIATETRYCFVDVETASELTRGMSIVDKNRALNMKENAKVCLSIDIDRWKQLLLDSLSVRT